MVAKTKCDLALVVRWVTTALLGFGCKDLPSVVEGASFKINQKSRELGEEGCICSVGRGGLGTFSQLACTFNC